jgi:uncharacterized protein (DUF488 family)
MEVYTIGHSNRSIEEFLRLLLKYGIEVVADVRRFPTSKHEHFKRENLKKYLNEKGIKYVWFEGLGGYRKKITNASPNTAIKSEGFRNYADYMMTGEFKSQIARLAQIARENRTAIMCAERFFWKCHRRFISDYLTLMGFKVYHIFDKRLYPHKISREARIEKDTIIYDVSG